ncbi:MAG: putative polymerase [Actinomycetia bacterium]|nr:putative polymerase [Actinomycetes bacterium]
MERGELVAVAVGAGGVGLATDERAWAARIDEVAELEATVRPRWVTWTGETAVALVQAGVRVATAWDVATVHRLLFGGWRAEPARAWARLHDLPTDALPSGVPDLFTQADDDGSAPLRSDGHLSALWRADTPDRLAEWARLALQAARLQQVRLDPGRASATARSESTAELLCAELSVDGLPVDRAAAEAHIAALVGPRPRTDAEAAELRAVRDREVLRHAPLGEHFDLRSPGQVKSLLRSIGIEVADTRAWRLEELRDQHPLVDALLAWRKAERVETTYGYRWLDEHVGADGRLRGGWSSADGAAGRMTASAGLHNLPGDMRASVIAEAGHVFVRADLGQIEPRVLAAVSGDPLLARATVEPDLYAPIAAQLDVDRATAKVAVLGAMYGSTTGDGARALHRLRAAYPVAMTYLDEADKAAQVGRDLRTYGGRLVRMRLADDRNGAAAMGRYGRNAMVQGAAAELFKVWAVTVRARGGELGARIVLCLHDELLVHAPAEHGDAVAALVDDALQEAAHRWAPDASVRFVAETSIIPRWSDAK